MSKAKRSTRLDVSTHSIRTHKEDEGWKIPPIALQTVDDDDDRFERQATSKWTFSLHRQIVDTIRVLTGLSYVENRKEYLIIRKSRSTPARNQSLASFSSCYLTRLILMILTILRDIHSNSSKFRPSDWDWLNFLAITVTCFLAMTSSTRSLFVVVMLMPIV